MNIKLFIMTLFAITMFGCAQQKPSSSKDQKTLETYLNYISQTSLEKNLYILASDSMEGRLTGEPGQKKSGKFIIDQYQNWNIPHPKNAENYFQKIPGSYFKRPFSRRDYKDSENIWAYIEGSDLKDELLIITAHYDHEGIKNGFVYNGADDNASGTAAVMEIASVFQKAKEKGHGPRRSILFLHVTAEELGLHGSRFYTENPLFPIENTIANINIDMVGRRDFDHEKHDNYVYVIGSDRLSSDLHNLSEKANDYVQMELNYKFNAKNDPNQFYYRSDHYNFAKKGIPAIFYFNGVHADYHQPTDTPDKIDYPLLTKRTKLIFATAWQLANADQRPIVDKDGK